MPRRLSGQLSDGPPLRRQLRRFVVVGVANTLISLIAYRLLLAVGLWYLPAAFIGYVAGILNGYVFNRSWTFGSQDSTRARTTYVAVQMGGAALTSLLVVLFVDAGLGRTAAFAAAAVPVTVLTFAANRAWTFAGRDR